jgi:hypothetical protein
MNRNYFPEVGIANAAKKLRLVSEALEYLDLARTRLAATEGEKFNEIAGEIEQLRLKVLKAVREVLPQ